MADWWQNRWGALYEEFGSKIISRRPSGMNLFTIKPVYDEQIFIIRDCFEIFIQLSNASFTVGVGSCHDSQPWMAKAFQIFWNARQLCQLHGYGKFCITYTFIDSWILLWFIGCDRLIYTWCTSFADHKHDGSTYAGSQLAGIWRWSASFCFPCRMGSGILVGTRKN